MNREMNHPAGIADRDPETGDIMLRDEPLHVPGEQHRFPDVVKSGHGHDPSLGSQTPSRVWGHSVSESLEVKVESLGIHAPFPDSLAQKLHIMHALGPGGELLLCRLPAARQVSLSIFCILHSVFCQLSFIPHNRYTLNSDTAGFISFIFFL